MKTDFFKVILAVAAVSATSFGTAQAATINIVRDSSEQFQIANGMYHNTATYGYDIDGGEITAEFADGTTENLTWALDPRIWTEDGYTYGSLLSYAIGDNIEMELGAFGFEIATTSMLTSLTMNMAPGNAVFDTTFDFDGTGLSTVGSGFGTAFELYDGYEALEGVISTTYSGIVGVGGAAPVGDLFTTMTVDFSGLTAGGIMGNIDFNSDLDRIAVAGDLAPVPLPASLSFLLIGLGSLGASRAVSKRRARETVAA